MATAKISKKEMAQDEFLEGIFDLGEWLETNWRRVAIVMGASLGLVLLYIGWSAIRERAGEEANAALASGIEAFAPATPAAAGQPGQTTAAPRYAEALTFFEKAADKGGGSALGDVARLFQARTLIAMSRAPEAVPILEKVQGSRNEGLSAAAKVALAQAVEATGNADRAAGLLQEVASPAKSPAYPTDAVLFQLAGVRERQGRKDEAKRVYDDLVARFPQSGFVSDAKQRSAELGKGQ